jgi:hypothetical protein
VTVEVIELGIRLAAAARRGGGDGGCERGAEGRTDKRNAVEDSVDRVQERRGRRLGSRGSSSGGGGVSAVIGDRERQLGVCERSLRARARASCICVCCAWAGIGLGSCRTCVVPGQERCGTRAGATGEQLVQEDRSEQQQRHECLKTAADERRG